MRIVVIGGGIAAQSLCESLRKLDSDAQITMVCEEKHLPYDRVNLSSLLSSADAMESLALRPPEWYSDHDVEVLLGDPVVALHPGGSTCTLESGVELHFDRAVIATGSDPLMPPIPGIDLRGVYPFRYPGDCAAIVAGAAGAKHAAVIGGGLLGLEAARGLAALDCPVTVVHLMDRLMERQLDAGAAALLEPAMEALGVEVLLERQTERILGEGQVSGLLFADGQELHCDLLVVSIGIKARTSLAQSAGLDCERGIIVDDELRTSASNVFAVGECAQHRGTVYGIVAPIYEQCDVAARVLLDSDQSGYAGSVMSAKLKVMGVDLVSVGAADGPGAAVSADADSGIYRKLVFADGRVTGAVLMGDTRGYEMLLDAVKSEREVEDPLALLAEAGQASAGDLPDAAQICNCNGVCKGEIVDAIREGGLGSTQEVVATTRAGAGCGSCKPLVTELLRIELGGAAEEPTYLCPCRKQTRENIAARIREHGWESVSDVSAGCGVGHDCGACKPGLAYLVSEINDNRHREERHARFINDRVHANIQNDGTFSVVPRMRGGVTTPDELRRIADVADKYEVPMVKVTGGQRIDLLGIKKEHLPAVWEELDMPSGHAYAKAVRTVKTCVGESFCRFGLGDSIAAGIELETMMEGLYTPHKVKSAVSGCPRNCAESYVKDIGIVAVDGGWEIYVGGAAGGTVRKGDLLATANSKDRALQVAVTFLQYYREHGEYLERTYDFVERIGMDVIATAVLDEETGEPARLRERFRIAKAAADPDPWLERHNPVHPKQFAELDSHAPLVIHEVNGRDEVMLVGPPEGAQL